MYEKMLEYVKDCLKNNDTEATRSVNLPFRRRSDHCRRVFMWTERLTADMPSVDREAILTASIFHDSGYAIASDFSDHARSSAAICREYLDSYGFPAEFAEYVTWLVENNSKKILMYEKGTPLDLVILMEADLLDETGALSIIWDCMAEGSKDIQSFEKTYEHIKNYSLSQLEKNPMVTARGRAFWEEKQKLVSEFARHLKYDLGL